MLYFSSVEDVDEYAVHVLEEVPAVYVGKNVVRAIQVLESFDLDSVLGYPGDYILIDANQRLQYMSMEVFEATYQRQRKASITEWPGTEVRNATYVFDGFFKIVAVDFAYTLADGTLFDPGFPHLIFERGDSTAMVVHNTDENTIELITSFRVPVLNNDGGWITELPAGVVEDQENTVNTAIRETYEELGYEVVPENVQFISMFYVSPGGTSERIFLYYMPVTNAQKTGAGGGVKYEGEQIEVMSVPVDNLPAMLALGEIIDAKTIIGLNWFLTNKI
jgi:ADP-ribose pyrophosphatase